MALLGSLLQNSMSDNPQDTSDVFNNYMNNRFGNTQPQTTGIAALQQGAPGIQMGPTAAAAQGQAPGNPLNQAAPAQQPQAGAVPTTGPVAPQASMLAAAPSPNIVQPQMPQGQPQAPQGQPQMPQGQPQAPQGQPQMPPGGGIIPGQAQQGVPPTIGPTQAPVAPVAPQAPAQAQAPMAAPAAPIQPAAPAQNAGQPPALTQPQPTPTAAPTPVDNSPEGRRLQAFMAGQNDPGVMAKIYSDPETPEDMRKAAADQWYDLARHAKGQSDAAQMASDLLSKPNGGMAMARELSKQSDEGSYLKAYLYHRLGMDELAKTEQQKLGAGTNWQQTIVDGKPSWVKYNGQGAPIAGYNSEGSLSNEQLSNALALKGAQTHTDKMQDIQTGKIYYTQTIPGQAPRLVDNQGKVYTGPSENLRSYGIGSDIATKNQIQLNELQNKLAYAPLEKRAALIEEYESKFGALPADQKAAWMGRGTNVPAQGAVPSAVPTRTPSPGYPVPGAAPEPAPAPEAAAPIGSDLSSGLQSKIVSGNRTPEQQQALWDESVAAGRPGKTAAGLPVARPGTSQHEVGNGMDLPRNLSQAERQELAQKGYYQPLGTDSVHWQRVGTAAAGAPVGTAQAQANIDIAKKAAEAKIETAAAGQRKVNEAAATTVANNANLQNLAGDIDHSIDILNSGKHNIGSELSIVAGRGPIAQKIGRQFETQDSTNTSMVMDTVNKLAAEGAQAAIKGHLSNTELQFWKENKPGASSSPEFVKEWLQRAKDKLENNVQYANVQTQAAGGAAAPVKPNAWNPNKKPTVSNW